LIRDKSPMHSKNGDFYPKMDVVISVAANWYGRRILDCVSANELTSFIASGGFAQTKVYHGKVGRGLSVEMSVKYGPVTLLSIVEDEASRFKLVVAEGESVPGAILEIGNTNSRYRFPIGARGFVNAWAAQGPAHHCAVGIGHIGTTLEKVAKLMGIGYSHVC
jgi:L-arabinose isomerase